MKPNWKEAAIAVNEATVRVMVQAEALQVLFRLLPSDWKHAVAAGLGTNVAAMMEEPNWPATSTSADSAATLQLAALLEALGEPPQD